MKKLCGFLLLSVSALSLTACLETKTDPANDAEEVNAEEIGGLSFDDLNEAAKNIKIEFALGETLGTILSDVKLPTTVAYDDNQVAITWSSSNEGVLSKTGKVTKPDIDTSVNLTARLTSGNKSVTKDFNATVLAYMNKTAYANALAYFRNAKIDATAVLPQSIKSQQAYQVARSTIACEAGYTTQCFSNQAVPTTQSDAYEDILETLKGFELIKNYSQLIEDMVSKAGQDIKQNTTINVADKVDFQLRNTNSITKDSYTFAGKIDTTLGGAKLDLTLQSKVSFNETKRQFSIQYTFDIRAGYALFAAPVYQLSAEVVADDQFNLVDLTVASKVPVISEKMTKLMVATNRDAVELVSYRKSAVLSDYKSYIYADNNYGSSYFWTNGGYFGKTKSTYEIFTPAGKLYESVVAGGSGDNKDEVGSAKFYFAGISGFDNVHISDPLLGYKKFKINLSDGTTFEHANNKTLSTQQIDKEAQYTYEETYDSNGLFKGFERKKTGNDIYYIYVNNKKYSSHGSLYTLPSDLTNVGMTFRVTSIEAKINAMNTRFDYINIMNQKIFTEKPGSEVAKPNISINIPGINKTIII